MKELLDLYREHINPDPDGAEIHYFFSSFNLNSVRVDHPEERTINLMKDMYHEANVSAAKKWILDNSRKNTMKTTPSHSPVSEDGQAPIVQFLTVRGNLQESYERDKLVDMGHTPEFACTQDYMTPIVIDMDNVIDYCLGKTYLNGQELDCVYPNIFGQTSPPLLCSPEVFKKIYEESRNIKIKSFEQWK